MYMYLTSYTNRPHVCIGAFMKFVVTFCPYLHTRNKLECCFVRKLVYS